MVKKSEIDNECTGVCKEYTNTDTMFQNCYDACWEFYTWDYPDFKEFRCNESKGYVFYGISDEG